MPKVNQKQVAEKLEEWATNQARIAKAENAKNKKLAPIQKAMNEEMKPILENFEKRVQPLREKSFALESEIKVLIEANRDAEGNPVPIMVSSDSATAVVEKVEGNRVVDTKKYFDFVKNKIPAFWNSIKVTIKEAEKIVGKNKIDELSDKKTDYVSTVKLK